VKPTPARVDLHAHLFFHEGVGVPWFGGFRDPIRATSWRDRVRSKVNAQELDASGAALVGVALYTHPGFLGSQRDSLRRQIREAQRFLAERPDHWALVRTPEEAARANAQGKRALVLTLEGAAGVLETEADLREFIDEAGIRIVTPFHFLDDLYGGAAILPGRGALMNPWAWARSLFSARCAEGVRVNPRGLTDQGRWLARALARRGVWIDFSHASDRSQMDLAPVLEEFGQPHLFTHTMLREFYPGERGVSRSQLSEVGRTRGVVGLLPSQDMMGNTVVDPCFMAHPCVSACPGGLPALLTQFKIVSQFVGTDRVTLGSDINAPLSFLPPQPGEPDNARGYYRYGQLKDLWAAMEPHAHQFEGGRLGMDLSGFLEAWSQIKPQS
jgi:microsomal dipeptidase-like Zn-dependent dipeptidase